MRILYISLLVIAGVLACEARGYSRGGSYSGYRSSSYSSYRSYTYRSYSGSSGYSSSYSSRGTIRYTRVSYYGSAYSYYYSMYYYMYVPASYRVSGNTYNSGASGNICKNYQANENGTVLGVFKCPLTFEPSSHIYCCGENEAEYCCKLGDSSALYGIIFGTLCGVGIIVLVVVCTIKCYSSKKGSVRDVNSSPQHRQTGPHASTRNGYTTGPIAPPESSQTQYQHQYNTRHGSNYPPQPQAQNNYGQQQPPSQYNTKHGSNYPPQPQAQNNYGQPQQQPPSQWTDGPPPPPPMYM